MKWTSELRPPVVKPQRGDTRIRKTFLWFPMSIKQKELKITRWLEEAERLEEWKTEYQTIDDGWKRWVPIRWLDIKETMFQELRDFGEENS